MNIRVVGSGLAAALLLAACNNVSSEAPLFTGEGAQAPPVLRAGMWGVRKEGCPLTASGRQPNGCTPPIEISAAVIGEPSTGGIPYVVNAGEPPVIQLSVPDPEASKTTYYYWAVEPIARDPSGRVTEAWIWPVQCGPLAPPSDPGEAAKAAAPASPAEPAVRTPVAPSDGEGPTRQGGGGDEPGPQGQAEGAEKSDEAAEPSTADLFEQLIAAMMTQEPYEGLTMTATGCTAVRAEPVMAAATAAREWYAHKIQFYWVGEKGTLVAAGPTPRRAAP